MFNEFNGLFLKVCRDWYHDKCSKQASNSCATSFGKTLVHVCGTVKAVGGDGSVSLCGQKHMHINCQLKTG